MTALQRVAVHAPAKINPWLAVLGRRDDGFHEIDAGLLALELGDRVELERAGHGAGPMFEGLERLDLAGRRLDPQVPADERNLALAALRRARERARELGAACAEEPLRLRLVKEVPTGAGLGGGSSDAAATLFAYERLLELDLGAAWRASTLAALGSDCVFFDQARATGFARCKGRGERVQALAPAPTGWTVVVMTPACACPTARVYGALELSLSVPEWLSTLHAPAWSESAARARSSLFNHLETAAFVAVPELLRWRSALDEAGAEHYRLSGSGSSFFGIYDHEDPAREDLKAILRASERRGLDWRGTWTTRPAGRSFRVEDVL